MDSLLIYIQTLVVVVITFALFKYFSIIYKQSSYWKKHGVPRLRSSSMILFGFGDFVEYCKYVYNHCPSAKYAAFIDFGTSITVLRDPELIKTVTIKYFDHFPDHRSFVTEEMDPIFGKNVFSLTGDRWREMRNTLSPSFTTNKMKFIFDLVSKCSQEFTNYLYDHPEFSSMIEAKDAFTRYTNDVIATVAFGIDVNSLKHRDNEFYTYGKDATNFSGVFRLLKFVLFRISPRMMRMVGIRFLSNSTSEFFWRVINETVKTRDERGIVRQDMIHLLMQARHDEKHQITIEDIVAQAFIFFLAGFDSSSTAMCHATYLLALNQDVQARLRDEVDRYLEEENGKISYESLSKMKYMDMVISETLRLYPPSLLTDRTCVKKLELPPAMDGYDGVTINPGESVWIPIFAIHRDPKYFPDPEKFDPERFSDENKNNIVPYTYIPFGLGPRQCIGNRFALMEVKLLMVHLLQKFVIKPNEKTSIPLVFEKSSFTLIPKDGFWVSFEKREY
uniref:cytochrome P450 9e2-like n=1 Tax=Osmia lignaria TaxID=473952 RepID=UPI0014796B31|nr:cytochrome P450 9e2-like [Osmia lignaria]